MGLTGEAMRSQEAALQALPPKPFPLLPIHGMIKPQIY